MQFQTLASLTSLLAAASGTNLLNLYSNHLCTAADLIETISLPASGCTNVTFFNAFSAQAVEEACIPTIQGCEAFDCSACFEISGPTVTTCQDPGNHGFISFEVTSSC